MTINVESYVEIEPGSPMTYDVRISDEEVEVIVGSNRGLSSSLRLMLNDPATCAKLARVLTEAGEQFERALCIQHLRST